MQHLPPRGHYLAWEVGRLAGVPGRTIGQWARYGYIRSSQSAHPRVYSYQDVIEAMVVHQLLDQYNVSHRNIKRAIEGLRGPDEYGDWPLTHAKLVLGVSKEGKKAALLVQEDDGYFDFAKRNWQKVETRSLERLLHAAERDLRRGGWAVRETDISHVEVNPDRLSGRPTIKGRRVPVESVAALAKTPEGVEILHDDYELTDTEIRDAERWWDAVTRLAA